MYCNPQQGHLVPVVVVTILLQLLPRQQRQPRPIPVAPGEETSIILPTLRNSMRPRRDSNGPGKSHRLLLVATISSSNNR